jgi:hypothetical protein
LDAIGTAEAVPFQSKSELLQELSIVGMDVRAEARTLPQDSGIAASQDERLPQGLKPRAFEDVNVRAEARTLCTNQHPGDAAEAAPFQSKSSSVESSADLRDERSG